ncbi:MAG: phosphodiester glycosidase family protein [Kouleothrix sp.]|nr:phosphodiester glycosidase family protein [Kouleothrix sp.]
MRITATRGLLLFAIVLGLAASCDVVASPPAPTPRPTRPIPTLFPTVAQAATAAPGTSIPDTGWQPGAPGLELRRLRLSLAPNRTAIPLDVVRLDLASVRLRVVYAPDRPRGLRSWFAEQRPLAAINGSFFGEDYRATALLVSDGAPSGASYEGFGGMLAVAQDGGVSLRPLRDQPYDPAEPLSQALQSFPMLVFPGGAAAPIEDDGARARRSAVALDRSGRLLLIACPTGDLTLRELAEWLSRSDLDVDRALNLDGGSSTGLFLDDGSLRLAIDSLGPLPIVLLVEAR